MEMMTMLMQLDPKLPQYNNNSNVHYNHYHEFPDTMEFSGASSTSSEISAPMSSFIVQQQQQQQQQQQSMATNVQHYLSPPTQTLSQKTNVNTVEGMREMIFRIAAMQPIQIDPEAVKAPQRKKVKISKDPQSVAARHRRERISEKIRILQRMVPGGTKMDTASMLDEAVHYVKFLKKQVQSLERAGGPNRGVACVGYPGTMATAKPTVGNMNYYYNTAALGRPYCQPAHQMVGSMQMLS